MSSVIYNRDEEVAPAYGVYVRQRGRNLLAFRLRAYVWNLVDADEKAQELMKQADKEGKSIEVNIQASWGSMLPGSFDVK